MCAGTSVVGLRLKLTIGVVVAALTVSGCASNGANVPRSRILTCLDQAQSASNVRLAESECHWAESRAAGPGR